MQIQDEQDFDDSVGDMVIDETQEDEKEAFRHILIIALFILIQRIHIDTMFSHSAVELEVPSVRKTRTSPDNSSYSWQSSSSEEPSFCLQLEDSSSSDDNTC